MKNNIILISTLLVLSQFIWAQTNSDDLGVQEVQITDYFIPQIPLSSKIESIPMLKDTIKTSHNVSFQPHNKQFQSKLKLNPIKAAKIKGQQIPKIYRTYVYGGVGNMSMPTSRIYYNSDRDKSVIYALELGYVESYAKIKSRFDELQKVSAAFRKTDASIFAKTNLDFGVLSAQVQRQGRQHQAYGYNPIQYEINDEWTNQYWGYSSLSFTLESKQSSNSFPGYVTKFLMSDLNEYTENRIAWSLELDKRHAENDLSLDVGLDYYINNLSTKYQFVDSLKKELIFTVKPSVEKEVKGGTLSLGFELQSEDKRNSSDIKVHLFPDIHYGYVISKDYIYAKSGLRGGLQKNSYWSFSKSNPFILNALAYDGAGLNLQNTKTLYDLYVAISTYLGYELYFDAECSYSRVHEMPFFELDYQSTYANKFRVVYDNASHFTTSAVIDWKPNEKSIINLSVDYHNYQTDSIQSFSYKPTLMTKLKANFNLGDKILPQIQFFTAFNRSKTASESSTPGLKDIIDFNLSLEYKYNPNISAYFKGYNMIGGYQIWENYPVLGPQVFFGLSFRL